MSNVMSTGMANIAASPMTGNRMGRSGAPGTWFEALSQAWGQTLDNQASRIEQMSSQISDNGQDNPSQITKLTTESLRMSFMANSSSTSIDSVGKALETMARKN
jgi:hypothetical protein